MMTLILGGSSSGKSAYAEDYLLHHAGMKKKYYIATMQVLDAEMKQKVERHQKMRSKKGFCTIEQPMHMEEARSKMEAGEKTALLECLSNLTANEMFSGDTAGTAEDTAERIFREIEALDQELSQLVIVSNNVFEDGGNYTPEVLEYIRVMGLLNQKLASGAQEVIEVVAGIPVVIKKELTV